MNVLHAFLATIIMTIPAVAMLFGARKAKPYSKKEVY